MTDNATIIHRIKISKQHAQIVLTKPVIFVTEHGDIGHLDAGTNLECETFTEVQHETVEETINDR